MPSKKLGIPGFFAFWLSVGNFLTDPMQRMEVTGHGLQ
jgi:hypothetical protein